MKTVVYVAVEVVGAMKPWTGTDKDAARKPFWTVVAIGSAAIRSGIVVAVGTIRRGSDVHTHADLRVCFGSRQREANSKESKDCQTLASVHKLSSLPQFS